MIYDKNEKTGLPELSDRVKDKGEKFFIYYSWIAPTVISLICLGFAFAIHKMGDTDKYEAKMQQAR